MKLNGCTRQDATHELLHAQVLLIKLCSASWVTFAESDPSFELEAHQTEFSQPSFLSQVGTAAQDRGFVRLNSCTRQDATHELLHAQVLLIKLRSASWVTFAESDQSFELEAHQTELSQPSFLNQVGTAVQNRLLRETQRLHPAGCNPRIAACGNSTLYTCRQRYTLELLIHPQHKEKCNAIF